MENRDKKIRSDRRALLISGAAGLVAAGAASAALANGKAASKLTLEQRIQRLEASDECTNLINGYELLLDQAYIDEILPLFALNQPDVRVNVGWGDYIGRQSVTKLFLRLHKDMEGSQDDRNVKPGALYCVCNTTGVVVVAGDGKTAKGLWLGPTISTTPLTDGPPKASQGYAKRGVDFIKEEDGWKIWHYTVYGWTNSPFGKSWAETNVSTAHAWPADMLPEGGLKPSWMYAPDKALPPMPKVPVPYYTFADTFSY